MSEPRDWDAATYERVSDPQYEWALEVLERLPLRGDERVLDAGCGPGRITAELVRRVPHGRVIGADASPSMVRRARAALGERADVILTDLLELELEEPVDAILSTATFHWIVDHDRLFTRLREALVPGGRLVAQCGGAGNVERFNAAAEDVLAREPFAGDVTGWERPWRFATPEETAAKLEAAGFRAVRCRLVPKPVTPPEPAEFLRGVCCGPHLQRLDPAHHDRFVAEVLARLGERPVLDYVRLDIDARRA